MRILLLDQPMRYDEAFTFRMYVSQPFLEGISDYSFPNNHLLHTVLSRLSTLLFGNSPPAIRLPALIAGVSLVPASYLVGRQYYNKSAGLLGAALVSSSSIFIEYSTNARGYTLLSLFTALLLAVCANLVSAPRPSTWLTFIAIATLGFLTIPVMTYPFASAVGWLLLTAAVEKQPIFAVRVVAAAFAVGVCTLIGYSPAIRTSGLEAVANNRFVSPLSWTAFLSDLPASLAETWRLWVRDIPLVIACILVVGFVLALTRHPSIGRHKVPLVLGPLYALPLLALQRVVPFTRVWLPYLPVFFVTAAAGIVWLIAAFQRREAPWVAFVIPALIAVALSWWAADSDSVRSSTDTGLLRNADEIALFLSREPKTVAIVALPSDEPLRYHLLRLNSPVTVSTALPDGLPTDKRVVVVVNASYGQSEAGILIGSGLDPAQFNLLPIRRFSAATVVEVLRREVRGPSGHRW